MNNLLNPNVTLHISNKCNWKYIHNSRPVLITQNSAGNNSANNSANDAANNTASNNERSESFSATVIPHTPGFTEFLKRNYIEYPNNSLLQHHIDYENYIQTEEMIKKFNKRIVV